MKEWVALPHACSKKSFISSITNQTFFSTATLEDYPWSWTMDIWHRSRHVTFSGPELWLEWHDGDGYWLSSVAKLDVWVEQSLASMTSAVGQHDAGRASSIQNWWQSPSSSFSVFALTLADAPLSVVLLSWYDESILSSSCKKIMNWLSETAYFQNDDRTDLSADPVQAESSWSSTSRNDPKIVTDEPQIQEIVVSQRFFVNSVGSDIMIDISHELPSAQKDNVCFSKRSSSSCTWLMNSLEEDPRSLFAIFFWIGVEIIS